MPKMITHESIKKDAKSHVPGGTRSVSAEAYVTKPLMEQPRKEITPRQDIGNQAKFHRGATWVGKGVLRRRIRKG